MIGLKYQLLQIQNKMEETEYDRQDEVENIKAEEDDFRGEVRMLKYRIRETNN